MHNERQSVLIDLQGVNTMKRVFVKSAALVLAVVMMITMLGACGKNDADPAMDAAIDAAVKAALAASADAPMVTFEADGQRITIEDASNMRMQQMLDAAGITLNEGDVLAVVPEQSAAGNLTIQVLRRCAVTVTVSPADPALSVQHAAVLLGGTVADALAALHLELADGQSINFDLDQPLEDGMEIIITVPEEEIPEETEPEEEPEDSDDNSNSNSSGNWTPSSTTPTEPKPTEPTEPAKTVVSVEVYEDCDGSGHGVKVITYSDGSQEEVYF